MPKKEWEARIYLGKGKGYKWVGRYSTRRERDKAKRDAWAALERERTVEAVTCDQYAERWLARYERENKTSSYTAAKYGLSRFRKDFGDRSLQSLERYEAREWAERVPRSAVPVVVTLLNAAVDDELLERNPFRGLTQRSHGRSHESPPCAEELEAILKACSALNDYAPVMRALITFGAYSGMRPGEIFALEWGDVDMDRRRILVKRRVYRGTLDVPKSNKSKLIALTPPARDALLSVPRTGELVFTSKRGRRLSQETLSRYWGLVLARADLDFDFYLASRHWCVHYLYAKLNLPPRVIAQQMGWSMASVLKLLEVYGHGDLGALEEIDRAFAQQKVVPLRAVDEA